MYANFSRLLGIISVKETSTHIVISGIPGLRFSKDIHSYWKTSKIANNLFTSIGRSSVKFPKFYAIEVLYILRELQEARRSFTGRRILAQAEQVLINGTWLKDLDKPVSNNRVDKSKLKDLTFTMFSYQDEFLSTYGEVVERYRLNGMLMDAAAGSGKTALNYALGHCLGADTKIMISPKNAVIDVWVKTINVLFKKTPDYWHSLSGEEPTLGKEYYIVHYDYLEKFLNFVDYNSGSFGQVFIAIDESHNFNEQSGRTSRLIELCSTLNARDVIHASGTPFKAMGTEAITLLTTICSDFTPEAQSSFRKIFGKEAKRANEILANRIGIVSFKVTPDQVETRGHTTHEVKVSMPNASTYTLANVSDAMKSFIEERMAYYQANMPEHEKLYNQCLEIHERSLRNDRDKAEFRRYNSYVKSIRKGYDATTMKDMVMFCNRYELRVIVPSLPQPLRKPFINVRAIIKYVSLKVMGEALSGVLGRMRIECHLDMLPHAPIDTLIDNSSSKTVIFTSYVEVVKELGDRLSEVGYKPLLIYGDTNKELPRIVREFEKDIDANPLIATFKSLSTAVPLIMASTEIFVNSPFRDYERTQAIARVDRVGQKHHCHIYELFLDTGSEPNISTRSKDILSWSKQQVEAILGVQAPDDVETSLESMVESPHVSLESAVQFIDRLREELPIDVSEFDASEEALMDWFRSAPQPQLTVRDLKGPNRKDVIAKFIKELDETYLNDKWLRKREFIETDISAVGIAEDLMVDGKMDVPAKLIGDTVKKVATLYSKWTDEVNKLAAEISNRDKAVSALLPTASVGELTEYVEETIEYFNTVQVPYKRFPKFQGTSFGNKIPLITKDGIFTVKKPGTRDLATVETLDSISIRQVAEIVRDILTVEDAMPSLVMPQFLDESTDSALYRWLTDNKGEYMDARKNLRSRYYERWNTRNGEPTRMMSHLKLIDVDHMAVALLTWMNRSVK